MFKKYFFLKMKVVHKFLISIAWQNDKGEASILTVLVEISENKQKN